MQYYFYINKGMPVSLNRRDQEKHSLLMERWDGRKWVDSSMIDYAPDKTGQSGYKAITPEEAEQYIKTHTY